MAGINQSNLSGLLGADPVHRTLPDGKTTVCRFSIAIRQDRTTRAGEHHEKTTWITVNCWNGQADMAHKYLKKGNRVFVSGELENKSWVDKDGTKVRTLELRANELILLDGYKGNHSPAALAAEKLEQLNQDSENSNGDAIDSNTSGDGPF